MPLECFHHGLLVVSVLYERYGLGVIVGELKRDGAPLHSEGFSTAEPRAEIKIFFTGPGDDSAPRPGQIFRGDLDTRFRGRSRRR